MYCLRSYFKYKFVSFNISIAHPEMFINFKSASFVDNLKLFTHCYNVKSTLRSLFNFKNNPLIQHLHISNIKKMMPT